MAILFQDGFDLYGATSELTRRWAQVSANISWLSTTGRFGGGRALIFSRNAYLTTPDLGTPQTMIISFAVKFDNGTAVVSDLLYQFGNNESNNVLNCQWLIASSTIQVRRGATVLGSFNVNRGEWMWISMKFKISNTVGTVDVEVNGASVLSLSGVDTNNNAGGDFISTVGFGASGDVDATYDDIIITDDTGAAPFNGLLSDRRIDTILANAAGDSSGWTPSAGSNFQNVDDVAPDDDTTYNEAEAATTKDLYNMGAMGFSPSVIDAATVVALVRNPDAGVTQSKLKVKSGITEGTGSAKNITSGYTYISELFLTNPDTAAAWTESEINAMQAGIEIV